MKKAFVDLDGTLINSKTRHISVLQKVLDEFHMKNVSVENFVQYKADGFSTKDYLINVLQIEPELSEKIALRWIELIELNEEIAKDVWYEDALDLLKFLQKSEYWIIAVSARNNKNGVLKFIKHSLVDVFFDEIIIVSPANAKKNKEKYILQHLGDINIVIGDTETDYIEDARVESLMLNRGFRSKEYWKERSIKSYDSLLKIIFKIKNED